MTQSKFIIFQDPVTNTYHFHFKYLNHILLIGNGYITMEDCFTRIQEIKKGATLPGGYELIDKFCKYQFIVKSPLGDEMARSRKYFTKTKRAERMLNVRMLASISPIEDLTIHHPANIAYHEAWQWLN